MNPMRHGIEIFRLTTSALAAARGALARVRDGEPRELPRPPRSTTKRRNILFITVDQQRYDALGVNGGQVARTPAIDALAREGLCYRRAHVQSVVCMPARSTMLTGLYPRTHGVVSNGVSLPDDGTSVASWLRERGGYKTALIGKAHFDPHIDPLLRFRENRIAVEGLRSLWYGFEHVELATHGPLGAHHYSRWVQSQHPEAVDGFAGVLSGAGGGDTGAPEVKHNPVPRGVYHTDWVADRTVEWLRGVGDEPFFCWVSFPDPHHPFDPPAEEVKKRIHWRDVPLPAGMPTSPEEIRAILARKPRHWLAWWEGRFRNPEGGPATFVPSRLTREMVQEMTAMIHVENELLDEAVAKLLAALEELGLSEDTDVFYTSDHGDLQGDHGLFFKGPYHVDSLMRVPFLWRPAPSANIAPAEIPEPVGHIDLAPTFCAIAGLPVPEWMQGAPLPHAPGSGREQVLTTWDSQFAKVGMHLATIHRDGVTCTVYSPSTRGVGGRFPILWPLWNRGAEVPRYDGTEGELYDLREDPLERVNLWSDPSRRALRDELAAALRATLPPARAVPLPVSAPT